MSKFLKVTFDLNTGRRTCQTLNPSLCLLTDEFLTSLTSLTSLTRDRRATAASVSTSRTRETDQTRVEFSSAAEFAVTQTNRADENSANMKITPYSIKSLENKAYKTQKK